MHNSKLLSLALASSLFTCAYAEEGMWTFDNPPLRQLKEKYDFTPTQEWLDHVRLSCVRVNDGGSASFISAHGLLLTNHHVARGQLQKSSTPEHDYILNGFYAATPEQEMKASDLEVNVLVDMQDVTAKIQAAVKEAKDSAAQFAARRAAIAAIERESQAKTGLRSDVVTLYHGGEYWLYRYKKYTDVRIVFAPEQQIAFYGGDPDNFTYPRYDLDMALFRVYENGKPLETPHYLKWNASGVRNGELLFEAGNPGRTTRLSTVAELQYRRDYSLPAMIKNATRRIATLQSYSARGPEQARQARSVIFGLQNGFKANTGRYKGLLDPAIMGQKEKDEADFRARVMANAEWKAEFGTAWDEIAAAEAKAATRNKEATYRQLDSTLEGLAMSIVEYVKQTAKPDGERRSGYHESQLESLRVRLLSPAPIYPEMEIARMTPALEANFAELGPGDPYLKLVLNGRSPKDAVAALIGGTQLRDPAVRKKLIEGGEPALAASADPLIVLARRLEPISKELSDWTEKNVTSVLQKASEKLGRARFAVYGKTTYPDATFTLRLSYGTVKGYAMNGTQAPYKTTFYGLYDRAASFDFDGAFALPSRYLEKRSELNMAATFNFVTTHDTIGGNSGSPIINRAGEIVGLVFDGNIESLSGDYVYEPVTNRTVSVHTGAMSMALAKMYGATRILKELGL